MSQTMPRTLRTNRLRHNSKPRLPRRQRCQRTEKRKAPLPIFGVFGLLALVLALAAGAYAFLLQTKLDKLQKALKQDEITIQTVADKAAAAQGTALDSQAKATDVTGKLGLLDSRAENKFKGYDDYITKSLPTELKKIPQLEARMIEENKALANKNTEEDNQLQDLRQLVQTNGPAWRRPSRSPSGRTPFCAQCCLTLMQSLRKSLPHLNGNRSRHS